MFSGKLFHNYFYGDARKGDFTEKDLPGNRFRLFFQVLSVRWSSMISQNLLYLICWIPAIAWTAINFIYLLSLLNPAAAEISDGATLYNLIFTYLMGLVPCIALTGPFSAGAALVSRNWARDEHSYVFLDFRDAVKANWKQGLAVGLVSGAAPLLVFLCGYFYLQLTAQTVLFYLPLGLTLMVGLLWALMRPLMDVLMVTYRLKLRDLFRNAFILTLAALPRAVLIRLTTLVLPLLLALLLAVAPSALEYAVPAVLVLYALFIPAFNKLLCASYTNAVCEKYLNPLIHGAETNQGLRKKSGAEAEPQISEDKIQ